MKSLEVIQLNTWADISSAAWCTNYVGLGKCKISGYWEISILCTSF